MIKILFEEFQDKYIRFINYVIFKLELVQFYSRDGVGP